VVNLGGLLLATGRLQEALTYNEKAVAQRPKDPLANAQAGITYFELGDVDRAEPALTAAERADPAHFTRPQLFLAKIHLRRGEREEARRELEDCLARHPDDGDAERLRAEIRDLDPIPRL
jgi:tetratricopeptide (TPR) repeat protein